MMDWTDACQRAFRINGLASPPTACLLYVPSKLVRYLEEWILDRHAAEFAAMLQVLAEQHAATDISGGSDDERIVERERVAARQLHRAGVDVGREGAYRLDQLRDDSERGVDLGSVPAQLAAHDGFNLPISSNSRVD